MRTIKELLKEHIDKLDFHSSKDDTPLRNEFIAFGEFVRKEVLKELKQNINNECAVGFTDEREDIRRAEVIEIINRHLSTSQNEGTELSFRFECVGCKKEIEYDKLINIHKSDCQFIGHYCEGKCKDFKPTKIKIFGKSLSTSQSSDKGSKPSSLN